MPEPIRKLAAIVFTDIVGYTKLASDDQSKASALLKQQRDLFQPIVSKFNGSWIKEVGDGLILTFDTVTDAVNCCIKLQETSKQIDDLDLRIGIHQGEIIIEENDIIGDDVNVAARIEPFSAPGGIAISNKVHDAIVRESEFTTKYLGKPKLKGVGQEVKVYCITSHDLPETDLSKVSAKLEPEGFQWNVKNTIGIAASVIGLFMLINFMFLRIGYADKDETPSIAILPFENKGAEADDFYAYGISSDLITDVTGAGLIRVASMGDIEKLDYNNLENNELAKKLFVRYVAKGTLWKMDTIFQLSMEIFDTKSSKVVYNKRWETAWKDLATIKDDLSDNILETLEIEVLQDSEFSRKIHPDAYELYLKGKHKFKKRQNLEDIEIAKGLLKKAIELDDYLLDAQLLLGNTFKVTGDYDKAMDYFNATLKQAEENGDKNFIGGSLNDIGSLYYDKYDYDKALDYYEKSLVIRKELDDKSRIGASFNNIGVIYWEKKDLDKALDYFEKSLVIKEELDDKRGIGSAFNNIGLVYLDRKDLDKALDYFEKSLVIDEELGRKRGIGTAFNNIGVVYKEKGNFDKTLDYYKRSLSTREELGDKGAIVGSLFNIGLVYRDKGDFDSTLVYFKRSLPITEELEIKGPYGWSFTVIGSAYIEKDDFKQAAENLEKALTIQKEIGEDAGFLIKTTTFLFLAYKQMGMEYDEPVIHDLIKETEDLEYETNFRLYELLEDKSYLETAYNQIQEKADNLEPDEATKFLSYPIPKAIVEEWEKVK